MKTRQKSWRTSFGNRQEAFPLQGLECRDYRVVLVVKQSGRAVAARGKECQPFYSPNFTCSKVHIPAELLLALSWSHCPPSSFQRQERNSLGLWGTSSWIFHPSKFIHNGQAGWLCWLLEHRPSHQKGGWFNFGSGHIPRLRVPCPVWSQLIHVSLLHRRFSLSPPPLPTSLKSIKKKTTYYWVRILKSLLKIKHNGGRFTPRKETRSKERMVDAARWPYKDRYSYMI